MDQLIVCRDCQEAKPVEDYCEHKTAANGRQQPCKRCRNLKARILYALAKAPKIPYPVAQYAVQTLLCKICQRAQPLARYYKSRKNPHNFAQPCIPCQNLRRAILKVIQAAPTIPHPPSLTVGTKWCKACETRKPLDAFYLNGSRRAGYRELCKECEKKRMARYSATHSSEGVARAAAWARNNPEKAQRISYKAVDRRRARLTETPFIEFVDIEVLYIRDKGICQLCFKKVPRKQASKDHVIPVAEGGATSYQNMALTHLSCNKKKGARHVVQQQRLF